MFGIASRLDVQIGIVTGRSSRLQRIVGVLFGKFLKAVEHLLSDDVALFEPALETVSRAYSEEAFLSIEDADAISILNGARLVVDRGDPITQHGLRRGDVHHFQHPSPPSPATGQK